MIIRLALMICMISFTAGCFHGMKVNVAPPQCTTDENSANCTTQPKEPTPMSEDDFFQDEASIYGGWEPIS